MRWNRMLVLSLAAIVAACGDDDGNAGDGGPDGSADTDTDADSGPDQSADCTELGLPVIPFEDVVETTDLRGTAADFTVPTTDGDWNLEDNWSGCDTYLFIPQNAAQNGGDWGYHFWDYQTDFNTLFARSPSNVHYFFVSSDADQETRDATLAALKVKVDAAITGDAEAWWADRVHYVTQPASGLEGWVGDLLTSPR